MTEEQLPKLPKLQYNEQAIENKQQKQHEIFQAVLKSTTEWGTNSSAKTMSVIALEMLQNEVWRKIVLKSHIVLEDKDRSVESLWNEAITDACIRLAIGDDDFSPHVVDQGNEVELCFF